MYDKEWLESLKAGDEVAVWSSRIGGNHYSIHVVDRITKTLIILKSGNRYRRRDGYRPGDEWTRESIVPVTDEIRDKMRRRILIAGLKHVEWEKLSTEKLTEITEKLKD